MQKILFFLVQLALPLWVAGQIQSLNGIWQFKTDPYKQGIQQQWYASDHDSACWAEHSVPGNWDLKNEYAEYVGIGWYRRSFNMDETLKDKRIRLHFESVYNDSEVWLNGKKIAENNLGFLPFHVDIQDLLYFDRENILVVRTDNTFKRGAMWNWGGIRRPVWLEITPHARLEQHHITAVPDLRRGTAQMNVKVKTSNTADAPVDATLRLTVSKDGQIVYQQQPRQTFTIQPNSESTYEFDFRLRRRDVSLWHFNTPHLYNSKVELIINGEPAHTLSDRFGIRKVEIDGYTLKLNGESIRGVGFNLVPEDRTTGNTLPLWRIKEDVDMMKSLGANMARLSHLPLPKEFLDYLDETGIMILEEVSLWGKDEMADPDHPTPKEWLERMVNWKYNHPSVIGWSVGNEIGRLFMNPKAIEYVKGAVEQAHRLDPNRLALEVSHSAHAQEEDPVKYSDMIFFNRYSNWGTDADRVHELHPGKPIFMAEFGNQLNNEDPDLATIDIKTMMDAMRGREFLIGASLWTFNDYRSLWRAGPTWTTPPSQNRTWGLVTTFRQKKRPWSDFKREYAPVRAMNVKTSADSPTVEVTIQPRDIFDIPAYPMRDYRLVWFTIDEQEKVSHGSFINLPEITPGSQSLEFGFSTDRTHARRLEVHLLDPQDYSVLDTILYFQTPTAPEIITVNAGLEWARIVFEPVNNATEYILQYRTPGSEWMETEPTINNFLGAGDLERFADYEFAVKAINGAGHGEPSPIATARTSEEDIPPVIWRTEPSDESFFIGFSVEDTDYLYEVALGKHPGEYSDTLIIRNRGVLKIPNLENGTTYYYRLRRRMQWGFPSQWTHEIAVTPDGGKATQAPEIRGVISRGDEKIMIYEPVHKATGYILKTPGGTVIEITQAQNRFFTLPLPVKGQPEEWSLEAR